MLKQGGLSRYHERTAMRYPVWKYILIVLVLCVSAIYSLPNLYPDEPAIQITGANAGIKAVI